MEQIAMGIAALGVVVILRRHEAFLLRWRPMVATWVALAAGLLAFGLSATMLAFDADALPAHLLHCGGI